MGGKVRISFAHSAIEDLEQVLAYYTAEGVPEVGRRLVTEVVAAVETVATHPDMGRVVPEFNTDNLRESIRPPVLNVNYFVRSATTTLAARRAGDSWVVRRARDWPLR